MKAISRRGILLTAATLPALSAGSGLVFAQGAASVSLDQLRKAGVVKVGIANQPPYSGMNPDGSLSGFVPTLLQAVFSKLGVPKVEGLVATYGELVPGLQAGRWQMIGASFRLSKERCAQVLFTDPVTFDGGAFAYVPKDLSSPPKSLAELGKSGAKSGMLQGSYLLKLGEDKGIDRGSISQFPSNPALIDALLAKRVPVAVSTFASLRELQKQRGGAFEIVYPVPDDPPVGSGPAFRREDTELHAAFQKELRAMRASGELARMAGQFGFETPADLMNLSGEEACARVS